MSRARDLADLGSGKTVAGTVPKGSLVHIETKTVADSSSSTTAFDTYRDALRVIRKRDNASQSDPASETWPDAPAEEWS